VGNKKGKTAVYDKTNRSIWEIFAHPGIFGKKLYRRRESPGTLKQGV
jgi:hypothetical protein